MKISNRIFNNPDAGTYNHRKAVTVLDDSTTALPSSALADGVSLQEDDRALFTNLSDATQNNKVYKVHNHVLVLAEDGIASNGMSLPGDMVYVKQGSHGGELWGFEANAWENLDLDITDDGGVTPGGGGTVAGNPGAIQFNDSGSFGGEDLLFWDKSNNRLGIGTATPLRDVDIFSTGEPTLLWSQQGQGTDNNRWQMTASGGDWYLQALNDDANNGITAMVMRRTGLTIDGVNFPNGKVSIGSENPLGKLHVENSIAEDLLPAITLRNGDNPTNYGFDVMHRTAVTGDLTINRVSSGLSTEVIRVRRDAQQVQIGQTDLFSNSDGSVLMINGMSNANILTVRSNDGGSNGAFSMGSTTSGAFIQGTDSALTMVGTLKLNSQGGDLVFGSGASNVGIGINTPTNPLHLYSIAEPPAGGLIALFDTGAGNNYMQIKAGAAQFIQGVNRDTDAFFGTQSLHPLAVRVGNSDVMNFATDGSVTMNGGFTAGTLSATNGASDTFTTADLKTVTVVNGIITSITV